jgi:hypothetical protein
MEDPAFETVLLFKDELVAILAQMWALARK